MTYDAQETSASDGFAVELYIFDGSISNYRLTSYATDYIYQVQTYTAVPGLKRKTIKKTSTGGSQIGELEVEIPFDHPMATEYAFANVPPNLEMTLLRGHVSDPDDAFITIWRGDVTSWLVEKRLAKLRIPSAFTLALGNTVPSKRWQGPCNHLLYDGRCGANRLLHDHSTSVINFTGTTLTLATLPWTNEGFGGEIVNSRNGERRTIQSHTGVSVTVKTPFVDLQPNDPVVLYMGCDHSATVCNSRFNNLDNYGGFNLVPGLNPFSTGRLR